MGESSWSLTEESVLVGDNGRFVCVGFSDSSLLTDLIATGDVFLRVVETTGRADVAVPLLRVARVARAVVTTSSVSTDVTAAEAAALVDLEPREVASLPIEARLPSLRDANGLTRGWKVMGEGSPVDGGRMMTD